MSTVIAPPVVVPASPLSPLVPAAAAVGVDFLASPRYTQATYIGRVQNFFSVIDPRTLLCTQNEIEKSVKLINDYKAGKKEGVTQQQIWNARKIKEACVHPDTGHTIFPLCRFSAFVPTNIPLVRLSTRAVSWHCCRFIASLAQCVLLLCVSAASAVCSCL